MKEVKGVKEVKMSRGRVGRVLLILVLAAPVLAAQDGSLPPRVRAAADAITAAALAKDVEFFASDRLLGRNTPSQGFDDAAAYIVDRLKAAGVEPAGDAGSFYQRYVMLESRATLEQSYLEIGGRRFQVGEDVALRALTRPLSGTYPVVYVGHGWTIPDKGIDAFAGVDVKGKLVLAHGPRALPKGVDVPQLGRVTPGATSVIDEAARRGAAGVLFVAQASVLPTWDQIRRTNPVRRELDPWVASAYAAPPVTSAILAPSATDALLAGEQIVGADLRDRGDRADYPPAFTLKKPATIHLVATVVRHTPMNVVARLEGSDPVRRQEAIVVISHLDGAVGSAPVAGDAVYNSADDNATGSAANLAIARQLASGPRPKRSVIFVWDSGEEQGLWGSRHFVQNPPVPIERMAALVNIDMIGATRAPGTADSGSGEVTAPNEVYLVGPGVLSTSANALIERVNRGYLNMTFNRAYDTPQSEFFYPRTDAGPFLERGILTIGFFTGLHPRYHRPADEAKFLDPAKMEVVARTAFATIWALADADERPRIDKPIPPTVPRYR